MLVGTKLAATALVRVAAAASTPTGAVSIAEARAKIAAASDHAPDAA